MNGIIAGLNKPASKSLLAGLGDVMERHRGAILGVQWGMVVLYLSLLIYPAFLPLPTDYVHFYEDLTLFAQFMFWGIWWPFVMVSMMLLGRVWCGVLCPEGALSEWASRHGLGLAIPRWLRWSGWPFLAFTTTTLYGQLISVYEYPKAALVVLGGSTMAAMMVGFVYGRGKRVWCRHLCPANGVFAILSRLAPIHLRVDREAWRAAPHRTAAVDCATLINIPNMIGNSTCHMCGRCSGHRGAVALHVRSPNREILSLREQDFSRSEALLLIFGILGIATGAFQWSASPWFVAMKQYLAEWLIEHEDFGLLQDNIPWWVLTHYPETNDVFNWLDGLSILGYICGTAVTIGGVLLLMLRLAGWLLGTRGIPWRLAYGLTPLAGINAFLGLSALTVTLLKAERVELAWVPELRIALLALAIMWSGQLVWGMMKTFPEVSVLLRWSAWSGIMTGAGLVVLSWIYMFYLW